DPADSALTNLERLMHRKELLDHKKQAYATNKMTDLTLRAKGISDEHIRWVRARRDGPAGRVSSKVRQIYIPNDKATIDGWLEDAARRRIDEAFAKLKANPRAWADVCREYSEDEATKNRGGELAVSRGDLGDVFGYEFETKLFDLPA